MKDYKFITITEIGRGWFEIDGTKKRMKKEEAIAFDEARVAEAEAKKIERLNRVPSLAENGKLFKGKFSAKNPIQNKVYDEFETEQGKWQIVKDQTTGLFLILYFECGECLSSESFKTFEQAKAEFCRATGTENDLDADITEKLMNHLTETNITGKTCKMVKINCVDCGRERIIKVQDQFQVKRCPECQKAHRNAMRRAKRAEKKAQQQANQQ